MNKLLVLTAPTSGREPDQEIVLKRGDHAEDTYVYVATIDGLLHYRHDGFSEDDARRLMA